MKRKYDLGFVVLIALLLFCACSSQKKLIYKTPQEQGLAAIDSTTAHAVIGFLSADSLRGRKAGTDAGFIASSFLASTLKLALIAPLADDYYQPFDVCVFSKSDTLNNKREIYKLYSDTIKQCYQKRHLRNVIAKIEGIRPNEFVIVGAHYDHLGVGAAINGDSIYNGADDNASGVSAVMQIAKAFRATGTKPLRTIIFAFWDGEEEGCLGSQYFTKKFAQTNNIKAYLNFDMIGRNNNNEAEKYRHVVYFYTEANKYFETWLRNDINAYAINLQPEYRPWDNPVGGSDNASFAKQNIPIAWFHTNGHPDYHKPSDEANRINYQKVLNISKSAFLLMWHLANDEF